METIHQPLLTPDGQRIIAQLEAELAAARAEVEELRADNRRHKDAVLALTKRCEEARNLIANSYCDDNKSACRRCEWLEGKP